MNRKSLWGGSLRVRRLKPAPWPPGRPRPRLVLPWEVAAIVLRFLDPASVLSAARSCRMFHDVVGSREYDFWDSWLRAPAGNFGLERRRAWDAAAALAATFTAVPAEIRVPVAVAQLAAKKCQFCCASPGIPVAPWGWRCCKGTHAVWELPWGLGKKHMAGFPAGKTKAFSKVHKHRIEFEVYSKFTVEQAARRLWEVPEGASLGERYKEGACRRKALIRTKLEERKLLHFTQRVSKIAFAKMRELELGAPWSEVERCVDEAVDECERHIREKRAARQGAPAAA